MTTEILLKKSSPAMEIVAVYRTVAQMAALILYPDSSAPVQEPMVVKHHQVCWLQTFSQAVSRICIELH